MSGGFFLFFLSESFQALGADFPFFAVNFFRLKIDGKFSQSLDLGMADLVSSLRTSAADIAYSRHSSELICYEI